MNRKQPWWVKIAVLAAIFIALWFHIPRGLVLTDEGLYLADAARIDQGDVPYRHQSLSIFKASDVPLALFMQLLPVDSWLGWRWVSCLIWLAACACMMRALPRQADDLAGLATFAAIALFVPFNIWMLNYNLLAVAAVGAGLATWFGSSRSAFAGGLVAGATAVVYTPVIAALSLPLLMGLPFRDLRSHRLMWVAGISATVALFVSWLFLQGLMPDFLRAARDLAALPVYGGGGDRLIRKFTFYGMAAVAAAAVIGLLIGILSDRRFAAPAALTVSVVLLFLFMTDETLYLTLSFPLLQFNVFWLFCAAGALCAHPKSVGPTPWIFLITAGAAALIIAVVAMSPLSQFNVASALIWVAVVGALQRTVWHLSLVAAVTFLLASALHSTSIYDEKPAHLLNAVYDHPRIGSIRSNATSVAEIQGLARALEARGVANSFILDYAAPGISYITESRPMLNASIGGNTQPPIPMAERWFTAAERRGRNARFAVIGPVRSIDPTTADYLRQRFTPDTVIGRYSIWRRSE
jgi:hypothetical protein